MNKLFLSICFVSACTVYEKEKQKHFPALTISGNDEWANHTPLSSFKLADHILDKYTGKYQMAPDRVIVITKNQNLLSVNDGDWSADLYVESNSKFYLDHGNVQFEFIQGQKGQVEKLVIYENGTQIEQGTRKN